MDAAALASSSAFATLRVEQRAGGVVRVISLAVPATRNAVSLRMTRELDQALNDANTDHQVRSVVCGGNGALLRWSTAFLTGTQRWVRRPVLGAGGGAARGRPAFQLRSRPGLGCAHGRLIRPGLHRRAGGRRGEVVGARCGDVFALAPGVGSPELAAPSPPCAAWLTGTGMTDTLVVAGVHTHSALSRLLATQLTGARLARALSCVEQAVTQAPAAGRPGLLHLPRHRSRGGGGHLPCCLRPALHALAHRVRQPTAHGMATR
jgi:hypothetical protein